MKIFKINKWLYPGIRMKRWFFLFVLSVVVLIVGLTGNIGGMVKNIRIERINIDHVFYKLQRLRAADYILIFLAVGGIILAWRRASFSVLTIIAPNKEKEFLNKAYVNAKLKRGPKIAAIGGGTGMPNVLRGMKAFTNNLSAVVTVADDGGSSGRLRKEYSILPPGDIRNCIVALADEETLLGKLFQYRFSKGKELKGHSFGNLYLTAMSHVTGDFPTAINESSKILAINGRVLPVTLENIQLRARMKNGRVVKGESNIPAAKGEIERVYIVPEKVDPYGPAVEAIKNADAVVIGPGSLYTSIIPNLLVPGIKEALASTKSVKIYICNIMTQPGETDNYTVADHLRAIFKHTGGRMIDYVIANNKQPKDEVLKRYAKEDAYIVPVDPNAISALGVTLVAGRLFSEGDYIRHSPQQLAKMIMKLIIV
ncbi:MAG: YvcK family protein [Spirochaetia bacterium]|nr:YvcK family protein [Spirochaetia bacterium]